MTATDANVDPCACGDAVSGNVSAWSATGKIRAAETAGTSHVAEHGTSVSRS